MKYLSLFFICGLAFSQAPSKIIYVTTDPSGSCNNSAALQWNATSGKLSGCKASTWGTVATAGSSGSVTVNEVTCTIGSSCTVTATPSGSCGGDLNGTFPNCGVIKINGIAPSSLATGILKNTTTTGVPSIAVASDIVGLFSTCSGTQYLGADGACHTASAGGTTIWTGTASPNGGDLAPHNMTSNSLPSPYIASCTNCSGGYSSSPPYYAFDGTLANPWATGESTPYPAILELDLGTGNSVILASYSLASTTSGGSYGDWVNSEPKTWTFQGSNDNSTWTTLDTETNVTGWSGGVTKNFPFSTVVAYRYFRINITANNGGSDNGVIGEVYLYAAGFTSGSAGDFYYASGTGTWYGPRPSGATPTWPVAGAAPVTFPSISGYQTSGTTFTSSGCSATTLVGGATAGSYHSGTTGTCTVVITPGLAATNGWACRANDLTTTADTVIQTATSTTTATLSGTTVTADVINFACIAY